MRLLYIFSRSSESSSHLVMGTSFSAANEFWNVVCMTKELSRVSFGSTSNRLLFQLFFEREREREPECICAHTRGGGAVQRDRERESQAGSMPSTDPDAGLRLMTQRS